MSSTHRCGVEQDRQKRGKSFFSVSFFSSVYRFLWLFFIVLFCWQKMLETVSLCFNQGTIEFMSWHELNASNCWRNWICGYIIFASTFLRARILLLTCRNCPMNYNTSTHGLDKRKVNLWLWLNNSFDSWARSGNVRLRFLKLCRQSLAKRIIQRSHKLGSTHVQFLV